MKSIRKVALATAAVSLMFGTVACTSENDKEPSKKAESSQVETPEVRIKDESVKWASAEDVEAQLVESYGGSLAGENLDTMISLQMAMYDYYRAEFTKKEVSAFSVEDGIELTEDGETKANADMEELYDYAEFAYEEYSTADLDSTDEKALEALQVDVLKKAEEKFKDEKNVINTYLLARGVNVFDFYDMITGALETTVTDEGESNPPNDGTATPDESSTKDK